MSKLFFSKEEKLILENNVLKENNLSLQVQMLQSERQAIITNFCINNSQKAEDVININMQEGSIEFKEAEIKNKSKSNSK